MIIFFGYRDLLEANNVEVLGSESLVLKVIQWRKYAVQSKAFIF